MTVSAIFAISENGVIGKDNDLPWRLRSDLRRFMKITKGHTVIMGRKSFESLGKPLPNRRNIVMSRNPAFHPEGTEKVDSLEEALALCQGENEVFIIGGSGVYEEAFDKGYVDKIYKTLVHAEVEGDVILRLPDESGWKITDVRSNQADEQNEFAFTYIDMEKVKDD